ncbi:hypothetical protein H074_08765 [Amycolatopsis decaplanina DSM 44594]|uniref:Uncharacterized protein n=1 Tax=Amycolatopsis decaplanina DSM 44594 TaxID=1284240 RepID=M2Z428_9PSEU|nr:hypothetical protein H074_08765 [Amycolatopsis decaplanina DSM 44594]
MRPATANVAKATFGTSNVAKVAFATHPDTTPRLLQENHHWFLAPATKTHSCTTSPSRPAVPRYVSYWAAMPAPWILAGCGFS